MIDSWFLLLCQLMNRLFLERSPGPLLAWVYAPPASGPCAIHLLYNYFGPKFWDSCCVNGKEKSQRGFGKRACWVPPPEALWSVADFSHWGMATNGDNFAPQRYYSSCLCDYSNWFLGQIIELQNEFTCLFRFNEISDVAKICILICFPFPMQDLLARGNDWFYYGL